MVKSLGEISQAIKADLIGDPSVEVTDAKTTVRSGQLDITFASNEKNLKLFLDSECLCVVVPESIGVEHLSEATKNFLVVDDVNSCFASVVEMFRPAVVRKRIGISDGATIAVSAKIAEDVDIYPGAFVGENVTIECGAVIHPGVTLMEDVVVGAGTILFPNVTIYENTVIGDRCILHAGVVIGAYGFGYRSGATHELSAQLGNVVIGNDVEIGGNTTIDRGTFDSTTIGDGTKIDDLVMIGHNCQIGKHNLLCSQVGIAGSTSTGDYVVMAGQVGVGDHLHIADKSILLAQSGVMHNLAGDQQYLGTPAIPMREQMQLIANLSKLPEMRKKVRELQKWVDSQRQTSESPTLAATESKNEAA